MKLSIVVPCCNEEESIYLFYEEVRKSFKNYKGSYELIFVNDGSNDNTSLELKKIYDEKKENIIIINLSRNFGKDAAMYAGLKEASGEYTSIIDADLQQRPEIILDMINILEKDNSYDCVAAYQKNRDEGKKLNFLKRTFYCLINNITDITFKDGASDFRTFRKGIRDSILEMQERIRFTKGIFSYIGFNTYYLPYEAEKRKYGSSKFNLSSLFKYALNGILSFSLLPLKISTYLGGLTIIGSIIYLIVGLILKIELFKLMLLFLISFFSGIILLSIGVVSNYISLIYIEVKNRPIYVIRDIMKNNKRG